MTNAVKTLYERIGAAEKIHDLVTRFYDLIELEPKYHKLRTVHGSTVQEASHRLYQFLSGWTGGPQLYQEAHGHPRLRSRHSSFKIGTTERDQWVACFMQAWYECGLSKELAHECMPSIYALAEWMRTLPDAQEGDAKPPIHTHASPHTCLQKISQLAQTYQTGGVWIFDTAGQ